MIIKVENEQQKEDVARSILDALPDWFAIEESKNEYCINSRTLPFWADIDGGQARGFVALKETSKYTAEIYVMGVLAQYHRSGIGRSLFRALYGYARQCRYEFIQVKTVKAEVYDSYDKTNAFYKSCGFRELECLPELWDKSNPCQIYVMTVK